MASFHLRWSAPLGALLLGATPLAAQTLVVNANQTPITEVPSSQPSDFTPIGSELFFSAATAELGGEGWITDGTAAGTRLLADLWPGSGSSSPRYLTELAPGAWVFAARTPAHGYELWRTDGTESGTQLVADIVPGAASSDLAYFEQHNGEVFFFASGADGLRGLWKTDGTEAGTVRISTFEIGGAPTFSNGTEDLLSTPLGLFFDTAGNDFWRLWLTDGTAAGTQLVVETPCGLTDWPTAFTEFNGQLYFEAGSIAGGEELWTSDGTPAGTFVVVDLNPGSNDAQPRELTVHNGELYFSARAGNGRELYKTDGTAAGTVALTSDESGSIFSAGTDPQYLTSAGGFLIFAGTRSPFGRETFASAGVPGQWFLVADIEPGPGGSSPGPFVELGGELLLVANLSGVGSELFATDGTPAGTRLVADIDPTGSSAPTGLTVSGGKLLFSAQEPVAGRELWSSDGTTAGTGLVIDLAEPDLDGSSFPNNPLALGSRAFYTLDDGVSGREPWLATGANGAELILDLQAGPFGSGVLRELEWRGRAWFRATNPETGGELYVSDGTAAGTFCPFEIVAGPASGFPELLGVFAGELYFTAEPVGLDNVLFATDGTEAGTRVVADIVLNGSSSIQNWQVVGDRAFFVGFDTTHGFELWSTDGTEAGTGPVVDLAPGSEGSVQSTEFAAFAGELWFRASVPGFAQELWRSDGTAAGTLPVADTYPPGADTPADFTPLGDRLLFLSRDANGDRQLFAVDATGQLTQLSTEDGGQVGNGLDGPIYRAGDRVFVPFDIEQVGHQALLVSDGTLAGTSVIAALDPTAQFEELAPPSSVATTDGRLVFTSNDGLFGSELWLSDGTAAGTLRLTDINPAGADSAPQYLLRAGSRIWFSANDGLFGRELHSIPLTATGGWIAESYGEGCPGTAGVPQLGFSGEARVGGVGALELSAAAPSAAAFLFVDLEGRATDLGSGCTVYLANPVLWATLATDGTGELSVPLAIPADPAFAGLNLWTQALVADPVGAFFGASLSDALEVVVGP